MRFVHRLAAHTVVPVFALVGVGGRDVLQTLRADPRVKLVSSPRHAAVLLQAGTLPPALAEPACRVHDQVPHPRTTLACPAGTAQNGLPASDGVDLGELVPALSEAFRALVTGERPSEPDLLPDEPPADWQGVGPHGQGGEGMMGGKPYGRPMPQMGEARDGLMLDAVPLRVGPFHPALPPGLILELVLQGDVVQKVTVEPNPFLGAELGQDSGPGRVGIAQVERARAQTLLSSVAGVLSTAGLEPLSGRLRRAAENQTGTRAHQPSRLIKTVARAMRWAAAGVVPLPAEQLRGRGLGHVARASGLPEDPRSRTAEYRSLGFEPIVQEDGDSLARVIQMLAEAEQSMNLAARAGQESVRVRDLTDPFGVNASAASSEALLQLVGEYGGGLEWGDAVTFIGSLGIDLEQAAVHARRPGGAASG